MAYATEDMAIELDLMVSMVDKDDSSTITEETTCVVIHPPDTTTSNSVLNITMAKSYYRYSNSRKKGSILNLQLDSYNQLSLKKEISFFNSRSSSFMIVILLRMENQTRDIIPSEHGRRETLYTVSLSEHSIKPSMQDEDASTVEEDLSTTCLTKEYSTQEHESMTESVGILPSGGLDNL